MTIIGQRITISTRRGMLLVALSVGFVTGGCRMITGVNSARLAIEDSTVDLQDISRTITNTVPALEEAHKTIEEAAQTIATITPAVETAVVTIKNAKRSVASSTKSIDAIDVAVKRATADIDQLCGVLETFLNALDRLTSRKALFAVVFGGGAVLIVALLLACLATYRKLLSTVATIAASVDRLENPQP